MNVFQVGLTEMRSPPRSCSHERLIDPIHWPSLSYMPGVIRYTGEQADERLGGGRLGDRMMCATQ